MIFGRAFRLDWMCRRVQPWKLSTTFNAVLIVAFLNTFIIWRMTS